MFTDPATSSLLVSSTGRYQWSALLEVLDVKLTSNTDRQLLAAIRAFRVTPDKLRLDTGIKKLVEPASS
jgi:hypothetical protein